MERPLFSYRFGSAEFDEARFELRVAGLPVEVERRALEVLAYLLRHSGEVVTKDELLREIWVGRVTVEKVLPNAINKLRRALGEANASQVATQARMGYRLDGPVTRTAVGRNLASQLLHNAGQAVPGRSNFLLVKQLGHSSGSEVWLAEHAKLGEQRVYKFALDAERLRVLKREATLLRVLQESSTDSRHFVDLIDWNFEQPPYFIECNYCGPSLAEWAEQHLSQLDTRARIALFLQIGDAVAAAHQVGVLHKDIKPANVLVMGDASQPQVRLTDFGSGYMLEPDRLEQLGITRLGMTVDYREGIDSATGTPLYVAPEHFEGHAPTVKSDVFALGILLYQLLSNRVGQPMVSGWEHEIDSPQLREDLRLATAGNPALRLNSVSELTARLRNLEARAQEAERDAAVRAEMEADKQRLTLARARKPYLMGLIAALTAGVCIAAWLANSANLSRQRAELAAAETKALNDFLSQDLISRTNPAVMAKGSSVLLKDALLDAQAQIATRFSDKPEIKASVHKSLAELFGAVELWSEAEAQAKAALAIYDKSGNHNSLDAQSVQSTLAILHAGRADFKKSDEIIAALSRSAPNQGAVDQQRYLLSYAHAVNLFNKAAYADALPHYVSAVESLARAQPSNIGMMNSVRRDQIHAQTMASKYVEAEANAKNFLRELESRPGDQSLWIALVKRASARSIGYQGRADEAMRFLLDAEPVILQRFGPMSMQFMSLQTEMLAVATRKGDYPRAMAIAERMYAALRGQLGAEHPQTAKALAAVGFVALEAGQDAKAAELLSAGCAGLAKTLGTRSVMTQNCWVQLTIAHLARGKMDDAQALMNQLDLKVLMTFRAVEIQPEVIRDGAQGIIDLSKGDASGLEKVRAAIRALDQTPALKDRFYRLLKVAEAGSNRK
jgi:eukaryotic-like serine/threonine-protein kinase